MPRGYALLAAALTLAAPGLAYSGLVMTELLFYPLLTLAAWAMAHALVGPTPRNQALLIIAFVTRRRHLARRLFRHRSGSVRIGARRSTRGAGSARRRPDPLPRLCALACPGRPAPLLRDVSCGAGGRRRAARASSEEDRR